MGITTTRKDGELLVTPEGSIDSTSSYDFETVLFEDLECVERLVVDFVKVPYVSSAGLRVLLRGLKVMNGRDGSFVLRNVGDVVLETLEITGLLYEFDIE